ncbi:6,7-dimethyl-8-ribityllumazine synthase [Leptospira interrogans str. 2003000735]|uniref:6,7-dimethyl-8-ribityllumazine synthase n=3 Tax=Leptospira interrogans TaxID=173 RepID=A0A829D7Q0_LEPIR|nr:6,7-dimethyl-8-ribityllumazine synthase [Leptospira interrogans]EMY04808.1 6,7-dimethyl-8-ribityllumazine synthase [Leptospira interrogans str. 2002000626]EMY23242.1 6,7-dimethyl-8-ribityllumazine synthase [Leptospira interrogans serovar Australis str. 200703203]ALE37692.1 riboflavin synthase beta chain [Leptospira interrogans serovar Hardjo str. Norma]ALN99152.1 6,7-dimethyl-8-ribityllumazine synthase [Leptospira interrogans serovar Hardjo-prajitno]EKN89937.1 6,7-dimethyl-8-ribityllumazine
MIQELKADLNGKGQKHCVIVSRFNEFITESLLKGALESFRMHGVEDVTVVRVPGAYEMPVVVSKAAASKKYDSIVCLGAVIRGATAHFDLVAGESAKIGSIGVQHSIPVIFGVLTTDTIEQAIERAGTKAGNKGAEAAATAVEMVNLLSFL